MKFNRFDKERIIIKLRGKIFGYRVDKILDPENVKLDGKIEAIEELIELIEKDKL